MTGAWTIGVVCQEAHAWVARIVSHRSDFLSRGWLAGACSWSQWRHPDFLDTCLHYIAIIYVVVVVNFLSHLIFIFPLFFGMVIYANELETKENKKSPEIKD